MSVTANLFTWIIGMAVFSAFLNSSHGLPRSYWIKSDLRSMATALEAYAIDHAVYPARPEQLTRPLAYLTSLFPDFFSPTDSRPPLQMFVRGGPENGGFVVWSVGPDRISDLTQTLLIRRLGTAEMHGVPLGGLLEPLQYDPTNGTTSRGDILRLGGSWAP